MMTEFIPPFPTRHKKSLGPLDILKYASRDLLSIWPEEAFERQFISTRIINRSVFIANCPDVIRHVLVTNHGNYEKKSPLLRKAFEPLLGDGLFISDGETWRQRRGMAEALFSPEQVAGFTAVMVKAAEECAQGWSTLKPGATLNVLPEMLKLSSQIIYRILFGEQADSGQIMPLIDGMANYHAASGKLDLNTFFGLPSWIPGLKRNQATLVANGIHAIIDKLIADGVNGDNQNSILAHLLKRQGNEALTPVQIRNELTSLFMAGQETAANTLAWAWYLISQCPDVEQRLHREIDDAAASGSADDFSRLPYARAIIEESMRLYPPVPILSREAVGDDVIRKRPVPAGSIMLVVPWLLHRHKLYWDKPDHFMPERFLADAPVKPDELAYIPFSTGPRVCVAQFFGTVETTLCLAILARHFRLTLPEGQQVTHECRLTLRPGNNLPMRITAR
jgi:cytochrome P450